MSVTVVGNTLTTNNGNATVASASGMTVAFDKTSLADGDYVVLIVNYGHSAVTFGVPTGNGSGTPTFTLAKSQANTTTLSGAIFYLKITTAMLADGTFTSFNVPTNVDAIDMQVIRRQYRGVDGTTPLTGTPVSAFSATFDTGCTLPQIASVVDGAYIVASIHGRNNGTATATTYSATASGSNPTSLSEAAHIEGKTAASSSLRATSVYEGTRSGAGSAGTWATTASQAVAEVGISVAFNPTAGAPTPGVTNFSGGAATESSAKVTAKLTNVTTSSVVRAVFATDSGLSTGVVNGTTVNPDSDGRVILSVSGLTADINYYYGIEVDGTLISSPAGRGRIWTNPTPGTAKSYSFTVVSCLRGSTFGIGPTILGEGGRFHVWTGDNSYSDRNEASITGYKADRDTELAITNRQSLEAAMGQKFIWSDHDYAGDNTGGAETGANFVSQAFRATRPLGALAEATDTNGIEQTPVKIGRVWHCLWDTRRSRSPEGNTDNSSKTMLGTAQKARLKAHALANPKDVKIWYFDCPWIANAETGEDHWGLYQTERTEIVNYLSTNNIQNVVIIAGDMHAVASDDGRNSPGGIPVFQAAPAQSDASIKGNPPTYQYGPEYGGTLGATINRYGLVQITDTGGSTVNIKFDGKNSSGTATITQQSIDFTVVSIETLRPTGIRNITNLTGAYTDIDEDPDTSNGADPLTATDPSGSSGTRNDVDYPNSRNTASGIANQLTNPDNAVGSSEASQSVTTGATQNADYANLFRFDSTALAAAVPSGATITGFSAVIRDATGNTARGTIGIRFDTTDGTQLAAESTTNPSTSLPATGTGRTVTPATLPTRTQLVASTFGVRVRYRRTASQANSYTLDWIRLRISYTTAGSDINTHVEVLMADPVGTLLTGTATGEIRASVNRKGTPDSGNPTCTFTVHENASSTVLATVVSAVSVTSGASLVVSGTFDQSVITNKNNVEVWFDGDGVNGATVELDAVEWNASIADNANFSQSVSVGLSVGSTLVKGAGKSIARGVSGILTPQKAVGKTISRPASATPTPQKAVGKSAAFSASGTPTVGRIKGALQTVSVGMSVASTLGKAVTKTISRPVSATPTPQKNVGKPIPFSVATSSALTLSKTFLRTIGVGISSTPSIVKSTGKSVAIPVGAAFTRVITVGKDIPRGISATVTQQKATGKTLPFAPSITYTLTRIKGVVATLVFGSTASPTVGKGVGKSIARPISATFSRTLGAGKSIPVTVTTTLSISTQAILQYFKTVGVNISTAPSIQKAVGATRNFSVTSALSIPKAITKTIARSVSATFTKVSSAGKTLARPVTASVSMGNKAIGKNVNQPVSATFTLGNKAITKTISRGVTVLVDIATGAFFNVQRTFAFSVSAAPTVNKAVTKTLAFPRTLQATVTRGIGKVANFNITTDTTIRMALSKSIAISVNSTFALIKGFNKTVQFSANVFHSISKGVEKTNNFVTNTSTSIQKGVEKTLSYDIFAAVRYIKHIGMSINVNVNTAVDILARLAGIITGPIDITISVVQKPKALFQSIPKPQAITRVASKVFAKIRKEDN